jgi:hypothetical protein
MNPSDIGALIDDRPEDGVFRVHADIFCRPDIFDIETKSLFEGGWKNEDEPTGDPATEISLLYTSTRSELDDRVWRATARTARSTSARSGRSWSSTSSGARSIFSSRAANMFLSASIGTGAFAGATPSC